MRKYILLIFSVCSLFLSCNGDNDSGNQGTSGPIPVYTPAPVRNFPHDSEAFTQGLFFADGIFYEGTGLYNGESSLRKVDMQTGSVIQKINLASEYFGEGITLYDNKIIQLTWKEGKGFVYDKDTFQLLDEFSYTTEGWGITCDGQYLIMSDGTDALYYLNPDDYSVVKQVNVSANGAAVTELNELEYINGNIYANIWQTDRIAIIQPGGNVIGWIDLQGILSSADCPQKNVLNGIAYNPADNRIYVTGKYWCKLFELEFVP
jgi:glutaminyl-peptide cyclotransferase